MSEERHDIKFSAKDETKAGLSSVQRNLDKTSAKADTLADRFRNMARATAAVRGPLDGIAARMSSVGSLLGSVSLKWVAGGAAIAGLTAVLKSSIDTFTEYEQSMLGIEQLIQQTGGAAGVTADQISEMADRIGRDTLASAGEVRDAAAVMLTFKSVAGETFTRSIELAQDMAAVMKQDLNSSVKQLGKVLEDPIRNLSALNRSGVSFTATQTEMIKNFVEGGDKIKAQTMILDVLAGQLGGYGKAEGGGVAGALDLVSENWSYLMRKIGETGVITAAKMAIEGWGKGLRVVASYIKPTDQELLNQKTDEYTEIINKLNENSLGTIRLDSIHEGNLQKRLAALGKEIEALREKMRIEKETNDAFAADSAMMAKIDADNEAAMQRQIDLQKEQEKTAEKLQKAREKEAERFAEQLVQEEQSARQSNMNKLAIEDEFYNERLAKIDANFNEGLINDETRFAQTELAIRAHNERINEIEAEEQEKRLKAREQINSLIASSERSLQGSLMELGNTVARDNEKLQRAMFVIQKVVAIANTIVATHEAAMKAANAAAPLGPEAAAAAAARVKALGYANVAVIGATAIAGARVHGGSVIGGRSYIVGENGPEIFNAPSSGSIINNKTINNSNSMAPVIHITNNIVNDTPESLSRKIEDSSRQIVQSIKRAFVLEGTPIKVM